MADEKDIKVRELEARNELSRIAYNQIEGRIEKLKAENAELREALKHEVNLNAMNLRQCENLKAQLSESQKRVKELEAHAVANEIKQRPTQCNCDLDNWQPEKLTGHSHVCRIHKMTMERLNS